MLLRYNIVAYNYISNIIFHIICIYFTQDINGIKITLPAECEENKIHFIETNLGRPPSKEKMNIIKKLNPQVKLRVFNIEEDNLIREYWSKFQKVFFLLIITICKPMTSHWSLPSINVNFKSFVQ